MNRMILVLMGVMLFAASSAFGNIVFNETFESHTVGQQAPSPWIYTGVAVDNGLISSANTNSGAKAVDFAYEADRV